MEEYLKPVWEVLNAPLSLLAGAAGSLWWILSKRKALAPGWAAYEGTIISAIKFAEKNIPSHVKNAGLVKLDQALKYTLSMYERATGKKASPELTASFREGIQIKHEALEEHLTLRPFQPTQPEAVKPHPLSDKKKDPKK